MKKIIIISLFMSAFLVGFAQNANEAYRYSLLNRGGTARFSSMSGAFSSLGADFSSLSVNPAGIGVYRSGDIMISPQITFFNENSKFNGISSDESKVAFSFPNFGLIFSGNISNPSDVEGWKNVQFGFGMNRLADYNNSYLIRGNNDHSSILDVYCGLSKGLNPKDFNAFDTQLAWNTYLINPSSVANEYKPAFSGNVFQQKSIVTIGATNEISFSFGANYSDKFYLGASLGLPIINYEESTIYKEADKADTISNFKSLVLTKNLKTDGSGANFKAGFIYRIANLVRISAAIHTPTVFSMHDKYSSKLTSDLDTAKFESSSPNGSFDYKLTTPMRVIGGIAFVIGKSASISGEYELVDYSKARFGGKDLFDNNEQIGTVYKATNNFRVGAEYIVYPFVFRAGFAYYASPYKENYSKDYAIKNITGGFGIKDRSFYLDFAYTHSMQNEIHDMYDAGVVYAQGKTLLPALLNSRKGSFIITIGKKF